MCAPALTRPTPTRLQTTMPFAFLAGEANTIKAQQKEFQALKKAAGNTFLARGMGLNYVVTFGVLGGSSLLLFNAYRSMYYGINKIEIKED